MLCSEALEVDEYIVFVQFLTAWKRSYPFILPKS
jgi:hypothetical protein